jgi:hypothetical protein
MIENDFPHGNFSSPENEVWIKHGTESQVIQALSRLQLVILGVMNLSLYKPYFPTLSNEQI